MQRFRCFHPFLWEAARAGRPAEGRRPEWTERRLAGAWLPSYTSPGGVGAGQPSQRNHAGLGLQPRSCHSTPGPHPQYTPWTSPVLTAKGLGVFLGGGTWRPVMGRWGFSAVRPRGWVSPPAQVDDLGTHPTQWLRGQEWQEQLCKQDRKQEAETQALTGVAGAGLSSWWGHACPASLAPPGTRLLGYSWGNCHVAPAGGHCAGQPQTSMLTAARAPRAKCPLDTRRCPVLGWPWLQGTASGNITRKQTYRPCLINT